MHDSPTVPSCALGRVRRCLPGPLLGLLIGLLHLLGPAPAVADERPNFVHIYTDDQTIDSLALMPFTRIVLGTEGTTFTTDPARPVAAAAG